MSILDEENEKALQEKVFPVVKQGLEPPTAATPQLTPPTAAAPAALNQPPAAQPPSISDWLTQAQNPQAAAPVAAPPPAPQLEPPAEQAPAPKLIEPGSAADWGQEDPEGYDAATNTYTPKSVRDYIPKAQLDYEREMARENRISNEADRIMRTYGADGAAGRADIMKQLDASTPPANPEKQVDPRAVVDHPAGWEVGGKIYARDKWQKGEDGLLQPVEKAVGDEAARYKSLAERYAPGRELDLGNAATRKYLDGVEKREVEESIALTPSERAAVSKNYDTKFADAQGKRSISDKKAAELDEAWALESNNPDAAPHRGGPGRKAVEAESPPAEFKSVAEADATNLPTGTIIMVDGRRARVK